MALRHQCILTILKSLSRPDNDWVGKIRKAKSGVAVCPENPRILSTFRGHISISIAYFDFESISRGKRLPPMYAPRADCRESGRFDDRSFGDEFL